jgi:hypothetical protein
MALVTSKQIKFPLSGSFEGDGSGLTNISASSIVGLSRITSGSITASVGNNGDIFLITSGSNVFQKIEQDSTNTIYSNLFIIKNFDTELPILTVSQSIVQFATQSFNPTGNTNAGSIWFTSSSLFIGLE